MTADPADDLLAQLNCGDVAAAEALFAAYSPYLRAVVRRQLSDRLRAQFDSADVVQSVWVHILGKLGTAGWQVADGQQLKGLLATIARRRLIDRVRKHKHDADRAADGQLDNVAATGEPRPSEIAQADDVWTQLLRLCPVEHHELLRLRRDGLTLDQIAERTGLHEGSVRRILRRLSREMATAGAEAEDD